MKILKKEIKNSKAITLIALVITIVVLIILAGVIISITLGNGGIIDRAKTAKEQYQNAQDYEEAGISKLTNAINNYVNGTRTESEDKFKMKTISYDSFIINSNSGVEKEFSIDDGYELVSIIPRYNTSNGSMIVNWWVPGSSDIVWLQNYGSNAVSLTNFSLLILEIKK